MSLDTERPWILVLCGWPLSGKTSTAALLQRQLGVHVADVDRIAQAALGPPEADWRTSEAGRRRNLNRMAMAYDMLHHAVRVHLEVAEPPRSLLVVSTYSRASSWRHLQAVLAPHPEVRLEVAWLAPVGDSPAAVQRLLAQRSRDYLGACTSAEEYFDVKRRFEPPTVPHLRIDSWFRNSPEACADRIADYLRGNRPRAEGG